MTFEKQFPSLKGKKHIMDIRHITGDNNTDYGVYVGYIKKHCLDKAKLIDECNKLSKRFPDEAIVIREFLQDQGVDFR